MSEVRPICKSIPVDADNLIAYNKPLSSDIKGIFSFTYYVPLKKETEKAYIYAEGIKLYLNMIKAHPETWAGWKVVLYMDEISYERVLIKEVGATDEEHAKRVKEFRAILDGDPDLILATIRWDAYKKNEAGSSVEPIMMRCFRNKALEDFPSIPVFIRDADTIFETSYSGGEFRRFNINNLHDWEKEYYDGFARKGRKYRFCVSANTGYTRYWHQPAGSAGAQMAGTFAGLVGSLGLWDKCISYMTGRCTVELAHAADGERTYVTKKNIEKDLALDEPILLYIIIPELFNKTFFFMLEFGGTPSRNMAQIKSTYKIKNPENIKKLEDLYKWFKITPSPKKYSGKYHFREALPGGTGYHTPITELNILNRAVPELNVRGPEGYFSKLRKHMKPAEYKKVEEALIKKLENIDPRYLEMERKAERKNRNIWSNSYKAGNNSVAATPVHNIHTRHNMINRERIDAGITQPEYVRDVFSKPQYHTYLNTFFKLLYKILKPHLVCKLKTRKRRERNNNNTNSNTNNSDTNNSNNHKNKRGDTRKLPGNT
jgi:hypothetical protein